MSTAVPRSNSVSFCCRAFFVFMILLTLWDAAPLIAQNTNFDIGTTVKQAPVKRLGINLGGQNFYDSGQMLRNLIFRNPGFEGETWQSALKCAAATATSCTDANIYNVWPANFLQGGTYEVINGAAKGETGVITSDAADNYQANAGLTINFAAPSVPLAAGDWVIVRTQFPGNATDGWWTSTSGGATLSTEFSDIAPDSPGKQALQMNAGQSGQSATLNAGFDTTAGRSFVQMNGTYTVAFKAKGVSGSSQLNVSVSRLFGATYFNQNVTLTNEWQDFTFSFNVAETGTTVANGQVNFTLTGGVALLDDATLTEAAAPDNPTAYRNAVVDTLRSLQPGVIRYMDGTDFGSSFDNVIAPPFARQRAGINTQTTDQSDVPMGLEEFLVLCQAVGAEPWYTTPGELSATEMQHLIEFLGGSSSTPYGAKRAALGQSAPWTTVFPTIHLELGNEMWNSGMSGEAINDPVVYGNRATSIFAAARASASFDASKFDLIMGSFVALPWWTQQEMANASGYDSVDAAPYIFSSLNDYSSNEAIFGPMFAQPEMLDSPNGNMYLQAQTAASGNAPAKLAVYEVNMGAIQGTAPQNVVNEALAGLGSGIAVADHMLIMMRDLGVTTQNVFALSEFVNPFNNSAVPGETTPIWGTVIDMGGETNLKRPVFLAEKLVNSAIYPTMLSTTVSGANPTWNQPLSTNDSIQYANAHYLQTFAFTDGTHQSVIVFNLSRSGSLPITFSGSNAPSGTVVISQLTSANPTDNNEGLFTDSPKVANPTQSSTSNFNPATPYSLPPYSMTVFLWPGAALPASTTALQAAPTSASTGQNVTLTATVTSQSGSNTPSGTVTFKSGTEQLGMGTLDANWVATFSTTTLPAGSDSITATYGGDSNDAGSTSQAVTVTITSAVVATTTALTTSANAINTGQSVTLAATVSPESGSNVPTGTITFLDGATSLGTASLNASGVATLSTSSLAAGTQSITASYAGDSKDGASVSQPVSIVVTQSTVATRTVLSASATQLTPGQNVTFTATVAAQSGSGVPTGTVTFLDGAKSIGTAQLNASGVATLSTTSLISGTHSITASYAGDSKDTGSVSQVVTVTVASSIVATTTTLSASAVQVTAGQSVTLTAKVAPQSGSNVATGLVTFLDGATSLGTGQLNASGVATLSTTSLGVGSQSVTASYAGDSKDAASASQIVIVTVGQGTVGTTTTLSASATQLTPGQSVTFTAHVTPQSGSNVATGLVTFLDGVTTLGTGQLNASGVATLSTTSLISGTHSITASYAGDSKDTGSVSQVVTVTVASSIVATTTTLSASAVQVTAGQSVTLTAKVAPQSGSNVATGLVTFLDGATSLGTGQLNASGVATLSTTSLGVGSQSVTASYAGDSKDAASASQIVIVTVGQGTVGTTTTLSASATQLTPGQSVTFTAHVTPQSGSNVATGLVTFLDGVTTLGTGQLNASGVATLSTTSLISGTHSITASYAGDSKDTGSVSQAVVVTVAPSTVATTTTLSASAVQVTAGQSVTLTAKVAPQSGSNVATGLVTFLDGATTLGTGQLNASGVATLSTTSLGVGSQSVTASYAGDSKDAASASQIVIVTVGQGTVGTTTTLSASGTQLTPGQSVTFTAHVTPQSGSNVATGIVTFLDGATILGTAQLSGSAVASLSTTSLISGTHSITASYAGDSRDTGSVSAPLSVLVAQSKVATATNLSTSATQLTAGQSVTLTAGVSPESGSNVATGTVTFLDGALVLGTASLNGSEKATFSTTTLAAGTHTITASYSGDSKDSASVSQAVSVVVTAVPGQEATTTGLTASATQLSIGQSVTFTATVVPQAGSLVATGTVTFLDGTTSLGKMALNPSGMAALSTSGLAAGTHSITASYGGDSSDGPSTSKSVTATVTTAIVAAATTTTLTASGTQLTPGQSVTFTAQVAPLSGSTQVTGTVTFLDGSAALGTAQLNGSGIATFTTTALAAGSQSITASYGGNANDSPSTSAALIISVTAPAAPAYAMVVSSPSVTLIPGKPSELTVTLVPENGFNLPISLSCSGLPQGVSCNFSPASVTPNGSPIVSTVSIMATSQVASKSRQTKGDSRQLAYGWVLPWGFIPLLSLGRRRVRSGLIAWSFRIAVAAGLIAGSLWVTGCGYSGSNASFNLTLKSAASNAQTHSSVITVNVQP